MSRKNIPTPFCRRSFVTSGLTAVLLLSGITLFSQTATVSEDLRFCHYLEDNKLYRDAVYVLKKHVAIPNPDPALSDSVHYFLGWYYYNLKVLDSSALYFEKVKPGDLYYKSLFFSAFNRAYLKQTASARKVLSTLEPTQDSSLLKLKNLEFASLSLLERDDEGFKKLSGNFRYDYFAIADEEKKSMELFRDLKQIRRKSPLLAGTLSALLPGSGKFYAGYKGQGIAALMTVGVMGLSAFESYYRLGPRSPQFITFGSLFTIFYIGNIWGSTISVKLAREHALRDLDDEILFNMHIPIRKVFN